MAHPPVSAGRFPRFAGWVVVAWLASGIVGHEAARAASPEPAAAESNEARRTLESQDFHDRANPDFANFQTPAVGLAEMPRDRFGFIDWMGALRRGIITPRASLDGRSAMNTLDLDVLLKDTKEMPWVRFPHLSHTLWLDCSNCHPVPFVPKAGANDISMADIFRGKFCGMCHDRVAFITFFACDRCHSVPQVAGK